MRRCELNETNNVDIDMWNLSHLAKISDGVIAYMCVSVCVCLRFFKDLAIFPCGVDSLVFRLQI